MKCKKILLTLLLSCSFIFSGCRSGKRIEIIEGNLKYTLLDDKTYAVSGYVDPFTDGHCEIPETVKGKPVTRIYYRAFSECESLSSVSIPTTVTRIDYSAFSYCTSLSSITIPKSVTTIDDQVFRYCSSLTYVSIPDSIMYFGTFVFDECENLQYNEFDAGYYLGNSNNPYVLMMGTNRNEASYVINERCKIITEGVFSNRQDLISIVIPDSVISICQNAFYFCQSLSQVTLGNSVATLYPNAFGCCTALTSINVPSSVKYLYPMAFDGCRSLSRIYVDSNNPNYSSIEGVVFDKKQEELILYPEGKGDSTYSIPNSVTSIGTWAFESCTNLTSIILPNGIKTIGDCAFSDCTSLVSINIPNTVKTIKYGAFSYCSSLISIIIPKSVSTIENDVFCGCSTLTIYCEAYSKPSGWEEDWNCDNRPVVWGYKG